VINGRANRPQLDVIPVLKDAGRVSTPFRQTRRRWRSSPRSPPSSCCRSCSRGKPAASAWNSPRPLHSIRLALFSLFM